MKFLKQNWTVILAFVILVLAGIKFAHDRGYLKFIANSSSDSQLTQARQINQYCSDLANAKVGKETCYSKQFQQLASQQGPVAAFKILGKLQSIDPSAQGCHLIAHGIGWGTFQGHPQDWQNEIQTMNPSCNYGAIHGVMEGYLASQPDHTLNKQSLPDFCGPTPRADCNHIIGHLTLVETRGNVPQALDLCDTFKNNPTQLDFCYTGVFMEEETALNLVEHGFADNSWLNWPARLPELTKMCLGTSGEKGEACWTELVHVIAASFENNPKQVFDYCSTNPDAVAASRCKRHGIGIMAAASNFNLMQLKSMCDLSQAHDSSFKNDCYVQLAASDLSTIPNDQNKVTEFCNSLEADYQKDCLNQVKFSTNYNRDASLD